MTFNWQLFLRQLYYSLFKTKNSHLRFSFKRVRTFCMTALYLFFYLPLNHFFFFLDEIFFPSYRKIQIKQPLFIIGHYRSGSTFLHRTLARDKQTFSSMRTFDIYFSPSISLSKIWRGFFRIDSLIGSPFQKFLIHLQNNVANKVKYHKVEIMGPEEDDGLLLYIWYSIFVWFAYPALEFEDPYPSMDTEAMSENDRKNVMTFYRNCVKRHLYLNPQANHFLSKNPSFTPKINAIYEYFPEAKIIYLVRNPIDMISSKINWFSLGWHFFSSPKEKYPFTDFIIKLCRRWYDFPLKTLPDYANDNYLIIKYDDLVAEPQRIIPEIYKHFNFDLNPEFEKELNQIIKKARDYKSPTKNEQILKEAGISVSALYNSFQDIYDKFGFKKPESLT